MIECVLDNWMNTHRITDFLAKGGQGAVYRTRDADIAIKLVVDEKTKEPIADKNKIEESNRKFDRIRLLPVPENLPLALPIAILRDNAGYVMRLLSTMRSFESFGLFTTESRIDIGDTTIPRWASSLPGDLPKKIVHYHKTGGLRQRLYALSQCAAILSRLHAAGLVYADISANNIFVSELTQPELPDGTFVWFIDADNLRYDTGKGSPVFTAEYGVPEVLQGTGSPSCSGDCYAFAILAFWTITLQHPFLGTIVDESEDLADKNKALAGLLPFVDDPDDDSNRMVELPRSFFLSKLLTALFEKMFCAGRTSPAARPPALCLSHALAVAGDKTLSCPLCGMTYYYEESSCPYCDAPKPPYIIAKAYITGKLGNTLPSDIGTYEPCWVFTRELAPNALYLPRRLFATFTAEGNGESELELRYENTIEKVYLTKTSSSSLDFSFRLQEGVGGFRTLSQKTKFDSFNFYLMSSGGGLTRTVVFNLVFAEKKGQ